MRKKQIEKLAREIAEMERLRRDGSEVDPETLTPAEQEFLTRSRLRGKRAYRHGWPDFLVVDEESGGMLAVEVKAGDDALRPSQIIMFRQLETVGLRVFVWNPAMPETLTPWRRYGVTMGERASEGSERSRVRSSGSRTSTLGRTRPAREARGPWDEEP